MPVDGSIAADSRGEGRDAAPDSRGEGRDAAVDAPKDGHVDAGALGALGYVGRWDRRDAAGPRAAWPGTKVRIRFRGTEAAVRLSEAPGPSGPSEWDVAVDGTWQAERLVPHAGVGRYVVASALAAGEHQIELYRRTEAVSGITQLLGVELGGGGALLPAPPGKPHLFEFVGDSHTNGYGIEGPDTRCPYTASTQNFRVTFAAQVALALDADEVGIAYQGKGVTKNYTRSNRLLFPELYGRALPDDASSLWSFAQTVPDVVVIMLGVNDYLQEDSGVFDPPALGAFRSAYGALLARIRAAYPLAHMFSMISPTITDATPAGYRARTDQTAAVTAAVASLAAAGDARVHYVPLPAEPQSQLTACDYHPGLGVHTRIAATLVPAIRAATGI